MASSSGTISLPKTATSGRYIEGKIEWRAGTSANPTVSVDLYVRKGHHDLTLTEATEGSWSYSVTVNGVDWKGVAYKAVLNDWVYVTSASFGTVSGRVVTISGSVTAPTGTLFEGHKTEASKTIDLDTFDLATTIDSLTCSTNYLDGTITANYTPKNTEYYNRRYLHVNVGGTLKLIYYNNMGKKSANQLTWSGVFSATELSIIYAAVPTSTKATIRVTFRTYSDSNYTSQIGDDQYREITLTLPTTVAPRVVLTVAPVNSNSWLNSKNIYVAGISGATASLSATAGAGADLTSTTITYDGTSNEAVKLNVSTLKKSGNIKFTAKALDTRNRSATASKTINVLQYSAPAVTSMQAERGTYNNGWTADGNGKDVKLVYKTTLSLTANGNVYKATFEIDGSTKAPSNSTTTGLASATEYIAYFSNIDGEASHTLTLTATDSVGKTGAAKLTIPTVHITMEFNDSGQGIAFGKTSEKDAFECAWDAEFHGTVIRIRDDGTILSLDDTGWIDLGISDSVTTTSSTSAGHYNGCAYRVVNGNHVYVAFNVRAEYSGSAVTVSGNPIPAEYRPKLQPYAIVTLNGKRVSRILVSRSTGHAMIDWIHNVADDTDGTYTPEPAVHTATWIDGYIDYFI